MSNSRSITLDTKGYLCGSGMCTVVVVTSRGRLVGYCCCGCSCHSRIIIIHGGRALLLLYLVPLLLRLYEDGRHACAFSIASLGGRIAKQTRTSLTTLRRYNLVGKMYSWINMKLRV
jgi:hypothetical protein